MYTIFQRADGEWQLRKTKDRVTIELGKFPEKKDAEEGMMRDIKHEEFHYDSEGKPNNALQ